MIVKYLCSFLVVLVAVSAVCSTLSVITRTCLPAGATMEEVWTSDFTLAPQGGEAGKYYFVDGRFAQALQQGITFVGSGPIHILSSTVEVKPKVVTWKDDRKIYSASGGEMVAQVKWEMMAAAADGARGDIHVEFPALGLSPAGVPAFQSHAFQNKGEGRWTTREATAYQTPWALHLGRFLSALGISVPMAILLHSIGWAFVLKKEKRIRLEKLALPPPGTLPRIYYPNPIAEWIIWTFLVSAFAAIGTLFAGMAISNGYLSLDIRWAILVLQGIGVVVGLIVAISVWVGVVTVRVDTDTISCAKGRSAQPHWETARWDEMKRVQRKARRIQGRTHHWVEVQFPSGIVRKIDDPEGMEAVMTLHSNYQPPPEGASSSGAA